MLRPTPLHPKTTRESPNETAEREVLRFIARSSRFLYDGRHKQRTNLPVDSPMANTPDCWRLPLLIPKNESSMDVIFLLDCREKPCKPLSVQLWGSFLPHQHKLHHLRQLQYAGEHTDVYWVSLELPTEKLFHYHFIVNDIETLDPINPQRTISWGNEYSQFFTHQFRGPISLSPKQRCALSALSYAILPLGNQDSAYGDYLFDIHFIDHWLTKQEWHIRDSILAFLDQFEHLLIEVSPKSQFPIPWQNLRLIRSCLKRISYMKDPNRTCADLTPTECIMVLKRLTWMAAFAASTSGCVQHQIGAQFLTQLKSKSHNPCSNG